MRITSPFPAGPWKYRIPEPQFNSAEIVSTDGRVVARCVGLENAALIAAAWEGYMAAASSVRNSKGPMRGDDGREYTLVRLDDFQAVIDFVAKATGDEG
jgi:hypothetical protein